jgi:hypothetical protein
VVARNPAPVPSPGWAHRVRLRGYAQAMPEPAQPDVTVAINQLELPDSFGPGDLVAIQQELNAGELRTEVSVDPASAPRDLVVVPALLIIHFLSQHGLDIALGVAEGAFWDGIKSALQRLRPGKKDSPAQTRVRVKYPDGQTVEVDVSSTEQLREVLRELRPGQDGGAAASGPQVR